MKENSLVTFLKHSPEHEFIPNQEYILMSNLIQHDRQQPVEKQLPAQDIIINLWMEHHIPWHRYLNIRKIG